LPILKRPVLAVDIPVAISSAAARVGNRLTRVDATDTMSNGALPQEAPRLLC
jgi:hypothetical protein